VRVARYVPPAAKFFAGSKVIVGEVYLTVPETGTSPVDFICITLKAVAYAFSTAQQLERRATE
jgi:hypothetical protein